MIFGSRSFISFVLYTWTVSRFCLLLPLGTWKCCRKTLSGSSVTFSTHTSGFLTATFLQFSQNERKEKFNVLLSVYIQRRERGELSPSKSPLDVLLVISCHIEMS